MQNEPDVSARDRQDVVVSEPGVAYRPHWFLEGSYYGPYWVSRDDNPRSPRPLKVIYFDASVFDARRPGEICLLTDPEYAPLLDTVRHVCYEVRNGKYLKITTASAHDQVARPLVGLVEWMMYKNIARYSHLHPEDFFAYAEDAIYGPGYVLRYAERIRHHLEELKRSNSELPTIVRDNHEPRLDTAKIFLAAGISPRRAGVDLAATYELCKVSRAEGLYLTPKQLKLLAGKRPKRQRLCYGAVLQLLRPWDLLWRMRHELGEDRVQFDAFEGTTLTGTAKEISLPMGRTKTAPVQQTMELIDRSIRWVLDYATPLLNVRDEYGIPGSNKDDQFARFKRVAKLISAAGIPEGPGSPMVLSPSTVARRNRELDFGSAVFKFIPVACLVVICAFTGRRHGETLSIRAEGPQNADCISTNPSGPMVEIYIEKTVQDWEKIPCNEVVVKAVEVLRRWSAPARAISGKVKLFQYTHLTRQTVYQFKIKHYIGSFVKFLGISPLPDGTSWRFTPHQFRRFFAIMFIWRYHYGNLEALSYFYRHFNPDMTLRYVTEADTGAIFRHVSKDFTTTILTEAAIGERNISGPFGERFKATADKLRQRYRRMVKVVSPKLARKLVERFVQKSGRRLNPMPWGYCACGTRLHQVRTARCLEHSLDNRAGPDLSRSSPSVCAACPHHITESIFEPFLRTDLEALEGVATAPGNRPLIRGASRQRAEQLRRHCDRSFKNSKPVEKLHG